MEKIMHEQKFIAGEGVYYYDGRRNDGTYDTIPATVIKVMPKTLLIRGDFAAEQRQTVRVSKKSCDRQIHYRD